MLSQSRTVVVQLKASVTVPAARQVVVVTHRMATPLHYGPTIVKTIVPTRAAAQAVVVWVDCSRTAKAWATSVAIADATADATADVVVTMDAAAAVAADDARGDGVAETIVALRLQYLHHCPRPAPVDAAMIVAEDAAADYLAVDAPSEAASSAADALAAVAATIHATRVAIMV